MLTVDARLELFKKQFPKEKVRSVQERQGEGHSVIEINHTWMCKSSTTQEGVALLDREVQLLKMLEGKFTVQIPVPVYYGENFLVYKKIPGSPFISYTFYRLGNKQRSKLILEFAQFLSQLHAALNAEEIASLNLTKSDWPWSLEKLQSHRHHLEENKDLVDVFDNIMNIYQEELDVPCASTLIHNSMSINNIIVDPLTGQLRGVIDFSHIAFDDPNFDLRMRRHSPIEFAKSVNFVYSMINKSEQSSQKLYTYYFVAEFSRYFKYLEDGKSKEAQEVLNGIIKSIRDFLSSHDNCNDESCSHGKKEA